MQFRSFRIVLLHVFFWIWLIHLTFDWTGLNDAFIDLFRGTLTEFDEAFILLPFCVFLFYWNSNYLIYRFLNKKMWHYYLVSIVISSLLVFILEIGIGVFVDDQYTWRDDYSIDDLIDDAILFNLLVIAMSSAWGVSKVAFENAALNKEAKRKQKEAELRFLTAQVNPHFLYNTLNGIYAQAMEENAKKTTEMILQLSEIMRYPLNTVYKKEILLSEEIDFVEKFIALQKLRLGEEYPITFTKIGSFNQVKIIPFILIPLVENAFKYGVSQKNKIPIFFRLENRDGVLIFESKNKTINSEESKSHLIGIYNLRERLMLRYGNKYSLEIDNEDGNYNIELSVVFSG